RETRKSDRSMPAAEAPAPEPVGTELAELDEEARARAQQSREALEPVGARSAAEYVPVAEGRLGHTRRQFVNRWLLTGLGRFAAGMEKGYVALYQKCVHLGCRVPWCESSQWFECPCHGSKYNRVGEKKGGPAPRGLDRFVLEVSGGQITVDTASTSLVQGPPIGTDTTGQTAEGAPCV